MRPTLTKRACDECIARKVKCSGSSPCDTCQNAPKRVKCTYLKPAHKRGPKARRFAASSDSTSSNHTRAPSGSSSTTTVAEEGTPSPAEDGNISPSWEDTAIPKTILAYVVHLYQSCSYSVWPVVNAEALLQRLESGTHDDQTFCLATALCAATMAQLQVAPFTEGGQTVDSSVMAMECMRLREHSNYRENLDTKSVLVSFFLHVYHAKINQRNSAMMFIQEAISGARLLKLDVMKDNSNDGDGIVANEVLFLLIWVSERGYAMHLGLAPSYTSAIRLPDEEALMGKAHVQGLVELAKLFIAFDTISIRRSSISSLNQVVSAESLEQTEEALSMLSLGKGERASTRMADYYITKEWMRTIVWQEALSRHLLSSTSYTELMTFKFPALVTRDLLQSLQGFTEPDLLPLGRDQLLKCFEVANSLADTVLLTPSSTSSFPSFQLGPPDFLHALYQKILPFLEQDPMLKSILRAKTAEALVVAPARLLNTGLTIEEIVEDENAFEELLDPPGWRDQWPEMLD